MSNSVTLGGERLGSGNKQKVELKNYSRTTVDMGYTWRSTMASGTLVPFLCEVGLPGDNFEIGLDCDIKTHPTIGPLFGSYKVQLDVFQIPVRLYNGKLHMNMLNIGLDMSQIKLPLMQYRANGLECSDNSQINPSSLLSYLGIRGLGRYKIGGGGSTEVERSFNAVPYLAYWDIYKNYYANKAEEIGVWIHNDQNDTINSIHTFEINDGQGGTYFLTDVSNPQFMSLITGAYFKIEMNTSAEPDYTKIFVYNGTNPTGLQPLSFWFNKITWDSSNQILVCTELRTLTGYTSLNYYTYGGEVIANTGKPRLEQFPLSNIDDMRTAILSATGINTAFNMQSQTYAPYNNEAMGLNGKYPIQSNQEALGIKTYQSDLYNNWISTDWIDGANGINAVTSIDTSSGEFSIDTLQLSRKVYDMLNRIAISGGSYDDWLNAVYTHERTRSQENPIYMGGLSKELAFQEIVSTTASDVNSNQPLGTLAGKGVLTKKHKGGKVNVRVDEPSYIMGIISLTPRIDYSQGNKWDCRLKTLDDFHKPALDEIGFQDLITDQMAWWDTEIDPMFDEQFRSAGKQPAWINYMTNTNVCKGNFAIESEQMFMTLNRKYTANGNGNIRDLTTYIDPSKFNNIFADTRIDAQNFWAQIAIDMNVRRKMSAKVIPNL